jgi:hypothetical protein
MFLLRKYKSLSDYDLQLLLKEIDCQEQRSINLSVESSNQCHSSINESILIEILNSEKKLEQIKRRNLDENAKNPLSYLYVNKKCAWPSCELTTKNPCITFDTFELFYEKHLIKEHTIVKNCRADILNQINLLIRNDLKIQREKAILNEMLAFVNAQYRLLDQYDHECSMDSDNSHTEDSILRGLCLFT